MKTLAVLFSIVFGFTAGVYFAFDRGFFDGSDVPEGTPPIVVAFHDQLEKSGVDTKLRPVKSTRSNIHRQYAFSQKADDDRFYLSICTSVDACKAEQAGLKAINPKNQIEVNGQLMIYQVDQPNVNDQFDAQVRDFFLKFRFKGGMEDPHKSRVVY